MMNKDEAVNLLKTDVAKWNQYRLDNPHWVPDLSNADLSYANLSNAYLSNADLSYASLYNANLSFAKLYNANLSNASLCNANLSFAKLSNANLYNANLSNASLYNANLSFANLSQDTVEQQEYVYNLVQNELDRYTKLMVALLNKMAMEYEKDL